MYETGLSAWSSSEGFFHILELFHMKGNQFLHVDDDTGKTLGQYGQTTIQGRKVCIMAGQLLATVDLHQPYQTHSVRPVTNI